MTPRYPDPTTRMLITIAALAAVMMTTLDGTIAIIALPRIQSSLVASQEQIAWVITSYLIAAAVGTPLSGWLADRFGRSRVMAISVLGFTAASIGCGLSPNLDTLVVFRFLQGLAGASLVPLSQVLLLDINPPEKHGPAIALFGIGTLLGPTIGPTLGAWLTEYISWRAIFLINIPIGVIGFLGLFIFSKDKLDHVSHAFDLKGFIALSMTLVSFQLMLDRGQTLDWFSSPEVCIEAAVAGFSCYIAVVHMFTARHPFIKPAIFRDRNFLIGTMLSAATGVLLNGVVPTVTNMMQQLLGYPVMLAGILSLPRAVGNMLTVFFVGRMVTKVQPRLLIVLGFGMLLGSLWILVNLSLETQQSSLAMVALLQGFGSGFVFLPLTLVVFSTLKPEYRNEGSTIFALVRSLGGAAGLSVIQTMTIRDTASVQARLVEKVRPDNPVMAWRSPGFDVSDPGSVGHALGEVMRQATMVAYVDTFRVIFILAVLMVPLCLMMRNTRAAPSEITPVHVE